MSSLLNRERYRMKIKNLRIDLDDEIDKSFVEALKNVIGDRYIESDKIDDLANLLSGTFADSGDQVLDNLRLSFPSVLRKHQRARQRIEKSIRDNWGGALSNLEALWAIAVETGSDVNQNLRGNLHADNKYLIDALTRLHARGCQVASEVITLLKSGYAAGAQARWRTLHEATVISYFILEHGNDIAERYLAHDVIVAYKSLVDYQVYWQILGQEEPTPEEVARVTKARDEVSLRFGKEFKEDYGWAWPVFKRKGVTFRDIENAVQLGHLHPFYRMGNDAVHTRVLFNMGLQPGKFNILLSGASIFGLADPGHCTAISLCQITSALACVETHVKDLVILSAMNKLQSEIGAAFLEAHLQMEAEVAETNNE